MKIKGLQKLTLIDYPGKFACTIFLFGCNFRCGFCHNPELVVREEETEFSKQEVLEFLEKRKAVLKGVCITGGEPLLTLDKDFVREIKKLGYLVKIDTNGSFPDKLKELIEKGFVDFVAMDVKTSQEKYNEVGGAEVELKNIEESMRLIANSGIEHEFRTTIVESVHSKDDLIEMAKWINEVVGKKPKILVLQRFKNSGKFIDDRYLKVGDTSESFLTEIKFLIKDYFERVKVR